MLRAVVLVVLLTVAALVWVGVRGAMAVSTLVGAQPALQDVSTSLASRPTTTVLTSVETVQAATARARALVSDPVWTLVQRAPVLGPQLEVVRGAVTAADVLAADALGPTVALAGTVRTGPFADPGAGYAALLEASEIESELDAVADAVLAARTHVAGVSTDLALPGVSGQLDAALVALDELADVAAVVGPGIRAVLAVAGQDPGATAVVVLDPQARPLGGTVERVLLLETAAGEVVRVTPLDPAAVAAAAQASPAFAAAAAAEAELLADRPAELSALTSTAGAGAAIHDGVVAVSGTAPRGVLLVTPEGLASLGGDAAAGVVGDLAAAPPEGRAAVLDGTVDVVVRSTLGLRGEGSDLARAIRAAVVTGGLRAWFADPALQAEIAGTRAGGALPSTTPGGVPVTVALDVPAGTTGPVVTGLRASAGTCGALWWRRAEAVVAADLDWPSAVASDAAAGPGARLLISVPDDAVVVAVSDGATAVEHAVRETDGRSVVVVAPPVGSAVIEVRLRGRGADADQVAVTARGAVPSATATTLTCS